jgi:hypothetical protein
VAGLLWLLGVFVLCEVRAARAIDGRVAARLEPSGPVWIGQRVALRVDLATDGLSFRDQRIRVPEIPGVLILEDAVETIKLSEQVDGETWQILRYEYPLFAQRAGTLRIPSMRVEFAATAGFGTEPRSFRSRTPALSLAIRVPPGVEDPTRLVTTSRFSVDVDLDPEPSELRVGDVLTRAITRRAVDVSGMAFAPLEERDLPGMAVYAGLPEVAESGYRGEMIGERVDRATYVFQAPGSFVIPGYEFEWWDPRSQRLGTASVPDLAIEVAASPIWVRGSAGMDESLSWLRQDPWKAALAGALLVAFGGMAWRGIPAVVRGVRKRRSERREAEPDRFAELVRACRSDDAIRAYNAANRWLAAVELAEARTGDEALASELEALQGAMVGRGPAWQGRALARAARRVRRMGRNGRRVRQSRLLPALNPSRAGPRSAS